MPVTFVALLQLVYVVVCRPYRTRLDIGFALLTSGNQFALCIAGLVTITNPSVMNVFAYMVTAQGGIFFVKAVVAAFWCYAVKNRRETKELQAVPTDAGAASPPSSGTLSVPLLAGTSEDADAVGMVSVAIPAPTTNPLQQ